MHQLRSGLLLVAAGAVASQVAVASQSPAAAIKVCSLVPKAEVKRLIGGGQLFDMSEPEEEAVGGGSSCNYPGVMVQVLPFHQNTIEAARKRGPLESVAGVGDEAFLYDNRGEYAELYARVGPRLLTLQRDVGPGQTVASVRAGVIELAKALVVKLR